MVSIADVKVSRDLRNADIYLSFYNKEEDFDPKIYFDELRKNRKSIKFKFNKYISHTVMFRISQSKK